MSTLYLSFQVLLIEMERHRSEISHTHGLRDRWMATYRHPHASSFFWGHQITSFIPSILNMLRPRTRVWQAKTVPRSVHETAHNL